MGAYLQITLDIKAEDRAQAAEVYNKYRDTFLDTIAGAVSKELLVRDEDVQVLHGFDSPKYALRYLDSELFTEDVVGALTPILQGEPEVRIYEVVA